MGVKILGSGAAPGEKRQQAEPSRGRIFELEMLRGRCRGQAVG